jgi:hypothetical protein
VRGLRLSPSGTPESFCGPLTEITYLGADPTRIRRSAQVAAPLERGGSGVVAFIDAQEDFRAGRLAGLFTIDDGCPEGFEGASRSDPDFYISESEVGVVWSHAVVALTATRFVAFWTELDLDGALTVPGRLRARVFDKGFPRGPPIWIGTALDPDGSAVTIETPEPLVRTVAAARLADGTVALAFQTAPFGRGRTYIAVHDAMLRTVLAPTLVDDREGADDPPLLGVAVASRGNDFGVAFTTADSDGGSSVRAVTVSRGDGLVWPVGLAASNRHAHNAAIAALDDAYVLAWAEEGAPDAADADGTGIRAIVVGPTGRPRFANPACDAASFQLNSGHIGDQSRPSLARFGDGFVAGWMDEGANGTDTSNSGLRGTLLRGSDLRPQEAP